tara:strand:+ start:1285 stop:1458 length:174 start_codon:yes stop_codon:yes gene_type:complete
MKKKRFLKIPKDYFKDIKFNIVGDISYDYSIFVAEKDVLLIRAIKKELPNSPNLDTI